MNIQYRFKVGGESFLSYGAAAQFARFKAELQQCNQTVEVMGNDGSVLWRDTVNPVVQFHGEVGAGP